MRKILLFALLVIISFFTAEAEDKEDIKLDDIVIYGKAKDKIRSQRMMKGEMPIQKDINIISGKNLSKKLFSFYMNPSDLSFPEKLKSPGFSGYAGLKANIYPGFGAFAGIWNRTENFAIGTNVDFYTEEGEISLNDDIEYNNGNSADEPITHISLNAGFNMNNLNITAGFSHESIVLREFADSLKKEELKKSFTGNGQASERNGDFSNLNYFSSQSSFRNRKGILENTTNRSDLLFSRDYISERSSAVYTLIEDGLKFPKKHHSDLDTEYSIFDIGLNFDLYSNNSLYFRRYDWTIDDSLMASNIIKLKAAKELDFIHSENFSNVNVFAEAEIYTGNDEGYLLGLGGESIMDLNKSSNIYIKGSLGFGELNSESFFSPTAIAGYKMETEDFTLGFSGGIKSSVKNMHDKKVKYSYYYNALYEESSIFVQMFYKFSVGSAVSVTEAEFLHMNKGYDFFFFMPNYIQYASDSLGYSISLKEKISMDIIGGNAVIILDYTHYEKELLLRPEFHLGIGYNKEIFENISLSFTGSFYGNALTAQDEKESLLGLKADFTYDFRKLGKLSLILEKPDYNGKGFSYIYEDKDFQIGLQYEYEF